MGMLGNISDFPLPDIFQVVEKSRKTGQLAIWTPAGVFRIVFYQGRVVATLRPDSKAYLRSLLRKSGALGEHGDQLIRHHLDLTEPLGKFLRDRDVLDTASLKEAFREQIQTNIYPLFSLDSGQFRFTSKAPIPYHEMTGYSRSSIEIAIEGIRRSELAVPDDDNLPLPDAHFQRVTVELPLLKLSPLEWSILEKVTPTQPLSQLSQSVKADLLDVRRAVRRLSKVSLIEETIAPSKKRALRQQLSKASVPAGGAKAVEVGNNTQPSGASTTSAKTGSSKSLNKKLFSRFTSVLQNFKSGS